MQRLEKWKRCMANTAMLFALGATLALTTQCFLLPGQNEEDNNDMLLLAALAINPNSGTYYAGWEFDGSGRRALYFKDGVKTTLPDLEANGESEATSILVTASDIIVTGYSSDASGYHVPGYWRNGSWS